MRKFKIGQIFKYSDYQKCCIVGYGEIHTCYRLAIEEFSGHDGSLNVVGRRKAFDIIRYCGLKGVSERPFWFVDEDLLESLEEVRRKENNLLW